jgi:hypothetical protein
MNSTGKRFELLIGSIVFGVALWQVANACLPLTSPQTPPSELSCAAAVQQLPCFDVVAGVTSDSSVTITFRGRTVSGGGANLGDIFILGVQVGTNEFRARTSSSSISVKFFRHDGEEGGIEVGSLQSVSGPLTTISNADCRVTYAATPTTPLPYDIVITFNVVVTGPGVTIC